ncbi:uncharacterized protein LOC112040611 [Quercus suber]|uniref:uncharacterized protein LOC112040611 n=1 Tax=Quercus suber TaxID=58331 RepID=UPI000CE1FB73|nr:uncharacterized protein LOC112040611 [Quercus suber]
MELKGALKPSFRKRASELVQNHNLAILVVMETRVGGDRAREITSLLPFDGAIHTDTIGYAGGLWVLWNVDRVDIALLFSIEQKIHAEVKVRFINISWLFLAVYASPRNAERQVLWKNLMSVAELHNMPWVTAGDFNEPLLSEDKFGGRAKAKEWNKNQFGNIFIRKKNFMSRLNDIQRGLALRPSYFLVKLEDELLRDLDLILSQEEELWALKSKVNWMIQGDRNTTFYHVSTLVRWRRNQIMAIKNAVEDWICEEREIKDFIRCGFDQIFLSSFSCVPRMDPVVSQWQPRLSDSEKESISVGAFEEEIKAALGL